MPMMRRGPLDRYPPEWVLRQANAHKVTGGIEFHTQQPVTFYLEGGHIYGAEEGVGLLEQNLAERAMPDEHTARDHTVRLLAEILGAEAGWYYHDPLGQHPGRGSWSWETATLLMDTRVKAHEVGALAEWADRSVVLAPTPGADITLGADAWAVVVELAESATAAELRARMGWSPGRLRDALSEIDQRGGLGADPTGGSHPAAASSGHHTGPLTPPPDDHRSLRQRVLPSRHTTRS